MSNRVLRLPEVIVTTGLSRSTVYAYMQKGLFPKSIPLGPRLVGWLESDINEWVDRRISKNEAKKR